MLFVGDEANNKPAGAEGWRWEGRRGVTDRMQGAQLRVHVSNHEKCSWEQALREEGCNSLRISFSKH